MSSTETDQLRESASELLLTWARLAAPHYRPTGSMDLDFVDFPDAEGPSYYNQFAHFAFLLLSEGVVPGASSEECEQFRGIALRNLHYILSVTDEEFHTPHYSRGRDWGRHIGEWLNYYALRSLALMQQHDVGGSQLRSRLSETILGAATQLVGNLMSRFSDEKEVRFPGNHATWHGLLAWEAGQYFDRQDWCDWARSYFERWILPTQRPTGVWPEGDGIVVNYSMVTAQAVSLFAESADDQTARDAMAEALGFFQYFNLPDGTSAVAADCRMRHHARPMVFFPPTFLRGPEGRALCLSRIRTLTSCLAQDGIHDNGAQGLAFYAAFVAELARWESREDTLSPTAPTDLPVTRADAGPWTSFLSWQLVPEHASRFIIDTQNFIELYHAESGYLVGTGNSKYAPRFSTVRSVSGGRAYIPERASCIERSPNHAACIYEFGSDRIRVAIRLDESAAEIDASVVEGKDGRYEFALFLAFSPGDIVQVGDREIRIVPESLVNETLSEGRSFTWKGRTFAVPAGSRLEYPLVPHNPYTQNGLPAPEEYIGRLSMPLRTDSSSIRIT